MLAKAVFISCLAVLGLANPVAFHRREVDSLDEEAFKEAQQRDDTAVRALSNVTIKTSDGKCLSVDKLSGDFRANLTPVRKDECGAADGQGWDFITSGKHNNDPDGAVLVVSTLTQACLNADPRVDPGSQINLFSCGGRADGEGDVADSQLFASEGPFESIRFSPRNGAGFCLTGKGEQLDIEECSDDAAEQRFTLGDSSSSSQPSSAPPSATGTTTTGVPISDVTTTSPPSDEPTANPTVPVAVSRAGSKLNPSSAAEAQEFDDTATRPIKSTHIRSPDGRCLSIDPVAGDFRQNIIPVAMVPCSAGEAGQKFDIVTSGKHNNGQLGEALVVSSLTNGCISFDARRQEGDTVTLFSCGGRADGEGETDNAQLYPFDGSREMTLEPATGNGEVCLVAGSERLESGTCDGERFELVDV